MSTGASISPQALEFFRRAIAARMGLRVEDDGLPQLEQALAVRLRASGARSVEEYLERRFSVASELSELSRSLSVGETYFMRNRDQFNAFEALLRARIESGARHLRVLSAGCSSGEEPYSIAILLKETIADLSNWNVSILAFDLNPDCIERARAGRYRSWSLRETPPDFQRRYFSRQGDEFLLDPSIRDMVRIEARNMVDADPAFWRLESFDVVFCRNILMYFTPQAAREAVERIAQSMSPGAYLFMGHAENLRGISGGFHLCHTHGTFYYQKRAELSGRAPEISLPQSAVPQPAAPLPLDVSWFEAIAEASARIRSIASAGNEADAARAATDVPRVGDRLEQAMDLWKRERFHEASAVLAKPTSSNRDDPDSLLLQAMLLVSRADSKNALSVCERLLEIDEFNAGAHYVKALCQEHIGNFSEAVEHDQTAVYLDPAFAMPHLHLGHLA
ncbi:partial putative biofilm formation methyltransferase WspC, partial [Planctomycetaceae bacterium]